MIIKLKSNRKEMVEGLAPEFPYVLHRADLGTMRVPWHWHEEVEFNYVEKGSVELSTTDQTYCFREGEGFFINTNVLCAMRGKTDELPGILESHLFHPVFLSGHFRSIYETKYMEPLLQNRNVDVIAFRNREERQRKILRKLREAADIQKNENMEFRIRNLFSEIWLMLLEEAEYQEQEKTPAKLVNQERVQNMISYIQQNYQERIRLEDIAAAAAVSRRECIRCFQSSIQKTPFEYLLEYRLEMAERLLQNTELPIGEIALQTGFTDSAYFGKMFKKYRGMSPGQYRRQNRHQHLEPSGKILYT